MADTTEDDPFVGPRKRDPEDPFAGPSNNGPMDWSTVGQKAVENAIPSTWNLLKGIGSTVMHPIDTGKNLYQVGKGAVTSSDPEANAKWDAVKGFYGDRYGSVEGFKKALAEDPAGVAMDLSTVFTGGEAALARIPGAARAAELANTAARYTNPVGVLGQVTARAAPAVSGALGTISGVGDEPYNATMRAGLDHGFGGPSALTRNMRPNQANPTDVLEHTRGALNDIIHERGAQYRAGIGTTHNDPTHLNFTDIDRALAEAHGRVHYGGVPMPGPAVGQLDQMRGLVDTWRNGNPDTFHTPQGFDALKKAIGEIRSGTSLEGRTPIARVNANDVYHAVRNSIVGQSPAYADTMLHYSDASDLIDELRRTFSLGEKASDDTALRKLQSVMRNNVQTNYGARMRGIQELNNRNPDIIPALAGQSLNTWAPRGIARAGFLPTAAAGVAGAAAHAFPPAYLAALALGSPRLMGELTYKLGQVGHYVLPWARHVPGAAKAINAVAQPGAFGLTGRQTMGPDSNYDPYKEH
jgi:hypothetical protein